jgi:hypothetical protein
MKPLFWSPLHLLPPNPNISVISLFSFQLPRNTMKIHRCRQRRMKKTASFRVQTVSVKPKREKKPIRFNHYHHLNEQLHQEEPKQEEMDENFTTSSDDLDIE